MKSRMGLVIPLSTLTMGTALCSGCSDEGPVSPDTGSPRIEVVFPSSATAFDRDDDGLVDLEIAFSDSGSGIDASTIRLTADRPLKGGPEGGEDLQGDWTVARADSAGLVIEETVDHLLPRGEVTLTISVADRAGNPMTRTIRVDLPPAALHKVIDLQTDTFLNSSQVAVSPDGRLAYVAIDRLNQGSAVALVDLERLEWVRNLTWPTAGLSEMVVDPVRGRLYIGSFLQPQIAVIDLAAQAFLSPIQISARGIGMALSQQRSELYIGLEVEGGESTAFISVVDVDQGVETRVIDLGLTSRLNPGITMGMLELVLNPLESTLFATTPPILVAEGILVIDPVEGKLLGQIDMWPEVPDEFPAFFSGANDLNRMGNELISTGTNPGTEGGGRVAVIPIDDPGRMRFGHTGGGQFLFPNQLAIAPDGFDWAITAFNNPDLPHQVMLMEAATLQVIWRDEMPLGATRPFGVAFRPDGNVFLVAGNREDRNPAPSQADLFVYLHR